MGCLKTGCPCKIGKSKEVGRLFVEKQLDMLGLCETKFRGTKDMNFGEVRVFKSRLGWRERMKKVWY